MQTDTINALQLILSMSSQPETDTSFAKTCTACSNGVKMDSNTVMCGRDMAYKQTNDSCSSFR